MNNIVIFQLSPFSYPALSLVLCLRGLALSSRSELQKVLERRKREQSDQEEEGRSRTPLEDELLRRQQKRLEVTNQQSEDHL